MTSKEPEIFFYQRGYKKTVKCSYLSVSLIGIILSACSLAVVQPNPISEAESRVTKVPPTLASLPTPIRTATLTPEPTATPTETPASSETPSVTPTEEPTITSSPTHAILRGIVIPDKVSCRYGPGAMYLYLYGMVKGARQEIVGRTDTGKWLLTRARGDKTVCWVKADLMAIQGDVMGVEMVYPDKYKLPVSPYYAPLTGVNAQRKGNEVVISWNAITLRAGDSESPNSPLYVAETWVCQNGQLVFTPIGAYTNIVNVADETGCVQPSHGRVYLAEKHGYAGPSEIPWPPAE